MTRRTIVVVTSISIDEDAARLQEDHDSNMWGDTVAVLRTAVHHICLDNLSEDLDPEVQVITTRGGIDYGGPS
jgi:hypothetical protein